MSRLKSSPYLARRLFPAGRGRDYPVTEANVPGLIGFAEFTD
jgi:hypothetical protein